LLLVFLASFNRFVVMNREPGAVLSVPDHMSTRDSPPGVQAPITPEQTANASQRSTVSPEDEVRGASPQGDQSQIERYPDLNSSPGLGSRAALPEGSLPRLYQDAQGDEHRKPPDNAPSPVNSQATVETARENTVKRADE
jgi:hypothetical protein